MGVVLIVLFILVLFTSSLKSAMVLMLVTSKLLRRCCRTESLTSTPLPQRQRSMFVNLDNFAMADSALQVHAVFNARHWLEEGRYRNGKACC